VCVVCTSNFGQTIQIIDSNHVKLDLQELQYNVANLQDKLTLKEVIIDKDKQLDLLLEQLDLMDSINVQQRSNIRLLESENENLQPTIWSKLKEYGFFIGVVVGVLIAE
jgi:hypothetical protein